MKITSTFITLIFCVLIQLCYAQSQFDTDSILVNDTMIYIKPIAGHGKYMVSIQKDLVYPNPLKTGSLKDVAEINGNYIDEVNIGRALGRSIPLKRLQTLMRSPDMAIKLNFNNQGNVVAVLFMPDESAKITLEELLKLNEILLKTVHITLPKSLKQFTTYKPYAFNLSFIRLGSVNPNFIYEPLHDDWVNKDIDLLQSIARLDKSKPQGVINFFEQLTTHQVIDSLGFEWTHTYTGKGAGYISVNLSCYYHAGKLVSYTLSSRLPRRPDLLNKYKQLYNEALPIDSGLSSYYNYGETLLLNPLTDIEKTKFNKNITPQMLVYMSPLSGTMYGYSGGLPISELENRRMFNEIKGSLSPDQMTTLMYSINPASRLTAIEYYLRNKYKFKNQIAIENWIKVVYAKTPLVESINGCIIYSEKPEKLIAGYLKWTPPSEN